ncbi:hypothetical protein [Salinicola halophilus]|uniref:hypothetical protein n=1 Tax=Salinicola halophilus TaxID=184065 RepID=UPI000DA141BB|nr:hypothetical protein [Salinicola halophilus]
MTFISKMPELPPLSEATVQDLVAKRCRDLKHDVTVPNCGVLGWESDVVSLTRTRLTHDFEIKVSRADWLAECRKIRAGHEVDGPYANPKAARAWYCRNAGGIAKQIRQHLRTTTKTGNCAHYTDFDGRIVAHAGPAYFWMVTPPGVIADGELPEYAGHIVVWERGASRRLQEVRPAPRLHTVKMGDADVLTMARGVTLRYWQQRQGVA